MPVHEAIASTGAIGAIVLNELGRSRTHVVVTNDGLMSDHYMVRLACTVYCEQFDLACPECPQSCSWKASASALGLWEGQGLARLKAETDRLHFFQ